MRPALVLVALAILATGCASRRIRQEHATALAAADARVLDGCMDCLLEARDTYRQLAASKYVDQDTIALRLFETNVLLAIRAKELAFDWENAMARAEASLPRGSVEADAKRLLRIADGVVPFPTGYPPDWRAAHVRARRGVERTVRRELTWLQSDSTPFRKVVRDYVALALDCSWGARTLAPVRQAGATSRRPVLLPESPPAIIYATGVCLTFDPNMLAGALAVVPRFHEAAYFGGYAAAVRAEEDGGTSAWSLLTQAYQRFPRITGLTFTMGFLAQRLNDCERAVRWFNETLSLDDAHDYALLGATECLVRLRRDSAAIETATRLLALESGSMQRAYYWRAMGRHRLRQLDSARADIEAAKRLRRDGSTLTLAGMIENDQDDLDVAEHDLREAIAEPRGNENCNALVTLGLVLRKGKRPAESARQFEDAMTCHEIRIGDLRRAIERIRARPSSNAGYDARRIRDMESDSTDNRKRYYASAFNAAGSIANAGQLDRALELLDVAAADASLAEPVAQLRAAIDRVRDRQG